jgi:hypothetical protein
MTRLVPPRWGAYAAVFCAVFLVSCVTAPAPEKAPGVSGGLTEEIPAPAAEELFWKSVPQNGDLIVIGVSTRRTKQEDAVAIALAEAARKVAFFHGDEGEVIVSQSTGAGFFDSETTIERNFIYDENYQKYCETLDYDDDTGVLVTSKAVYVRARYTPDEPFTVDYTPRYLPASQTPDWVKNPPPKIGGFVIGVGYSGKIADPKNAFIISYESAVASIMGKIDSTVSGELESTETDRGTSYSSRNIQRDSARLERFYVLETWIDPGDNTVWTLAVATAKEAAAHEDIANEVGDEVIVNELITDEAALQKSIQITGGDDEDT